MAKANDIKNGKAQKVLGKILIQKALVSLNFTFPNPVMSAM